MKIQNLIILLLVIYAGIISFKFFTKPEEEVYDFQKVQDQYDSLKKVNAALEESRTIDIREAIQLRYSLDSIKAVRPKNIKRTNDEVTRLHNSTTADKLSIIDSILRSRKGQH